MNKDDEDRHEASRALIERLTADRNFELGMIKIPTRKQLIDKLANYPRSNASFATNAVHVVDADGCKDYGPDDVRSSNLAHELFEVWVWVWVDWVSVERVLDHFVVKVRHSSPIDVRAELWAWLTGHKYAARWSSTFDLQVKATKA